MNGSLLVMAGGEEQVFEEQRPLLSHLCQEPQLVGPVGSGAATKLALNQLIASLTHSFSLSLQLIQRAGVPVETFMAILRPSALYAPTFDKKLQRMLDHSYADPHFSTALLRKDLRLFLEEATTAGLQDQGLSGLLSLLEQAKGTELDEQDYCALHELTVLSCVNALPSRFSPEVWIPPPLRPLPLSKATASSACLLTTASAIAANWTPPLQLLSNLAWQSITASA